jgi:uncharacterized protein YcbX
MFDYTWISVSATAAAIAAGGLYMYARRNRSKPAPKPAISHIVFYPVKGCAGIERYSAIIGENGILHDREYVVVRWSESENRFAALSQSKYPKLARVVPSEVSDTGITLSAPDLPKLVHRMKPEGKEVAIHFYGDEIKAVDQGDEASTWLSSFLGTDVRFVRLAPGLHRAKVDGDKVANSIFYRTPVLLMSTESLADLSSRAGFETGHSRFRPNIVVSGMARPWEEDEIESFRIGDLKLETSEPCERCSVPAVDPLTGILDNAKLAAMRRARSGKTVKPDEYYVGTYFKPILSGADKTTRIYIGQEITFH